jgi:hydrogenase maturation factor
MADAYPLPPGKLPHDLLAALLAGLPVTHPDLLLGPAVGEDCAILRPPSGAAGALLVVKSDPVTFATDEIGHYAVNVCANDIAVTGGVPLFYLPTLLFPAGTTDTALATQVFAQIGAACRRLGITVAGGHSEITAAVTQVVVAGTMIGQVAPERLVHSGGVRAGDLVLLAGAFPLEGASIIARAFGAELAQRGIAAAEVAQAAGYLHDPGISVVQMAGLATAAGLVSALHDPTEGGVATALLELALAGGVGLAVVLAALRPDPLAARLCACFGLDPLGVIASGALLAAAAPTQVAALQALWSAHGVASAVVGRALPPEDGIFAQLQGRRLELPRFVADEITRLWA